MPRSKHATLLAIATGALALYALLAVAVFSHIATRERMEVRQSVDNMGWAGSHFQTEFYKFEQRLSAFAAEIPGVDPTEVQLRFDILLGRLETLRSGAQREVYGDNAELAQTYDLIRGKVVGLEPVMTSVIGGDRRQIPSILAVLRGLEAPVAKLASGISRFAIAERAALGASILRASNWFGVLLVGQVITLLLLGSFLWRQFSELQRSQTSLEASNKALVASQADVRRNEYRFRQFVSNMRDIVVCMGTKGQSDFGYDASGVLLLGREFDRIAGTRGATTGLAEIGKWYDAVHPEDRAAYKEAERRRKENGEAYSLTYRFTHPETGEQRWAAETGWATKDPASDAVFYDSYIVDVTGQKNLEARLRESQSILQSVVDNSPIGINVKDRAGRYVLMNRHLARLFGTTPDAAFGRLPESAHGPNYRNPRHQESHRQVVESGEPIIGSEDIFAGMTGDETWITNKVPVKDAAGEVRYVVTVSMPVPQLATANKALAENRAMLLEAERQAKIVNWNQPLNSDAGTVWSESITEILGLPSELVSSDANFLNYVHAEDRERVRAEFARTTENPGSYELDYRFVRPDGRTIWLRTTAKVHLGKERLGSRLIGTIQDITDQKTVELALRESEARLRSFMHNAPVGMIIKTTEQKLLMVNPFVARAYNKPESAFLGRRTSDLALSEGARVIEDLERTVIATGRAKSKEVFFPDHATNPWTHQVRFPIFDENGVLTSIGGFAIDITEQKNAEIARQETESLFRSFLENSPEGMAVKDRDGRFLMVNRHVEAEFGLPAKEILGRRSAEIASAEEAEAAESMDRQVLESGQAIEREIHLPARSDFEWTYTVKFPIKDAAGRITAIGGFGFDIGERKRAELALRDSEARLRSFMDNSPAAMSIKDTDRRFVMLNARAAQTLRGRVADIVGRRTIEVLPALGAEAIDAMEREVVEFGKTVVREVHFPERAGDRWTQEVKFPVRDAEGRISGIGGFGIDISEWKQSEIALRNSEALLREAQRSAKLAYWNWEASTGWTSAWSDCASDVLGIAPLPVPIEDEDYRDLIHPDDREIAAKAHHEIFYDLRPYNIEYRFRRADGGYNWIHESANVEANADGAPVRMVGTIQNITERKQMERALRDSEARLRDAIESMNDGFAIFDADDRFVMSNAKFLTEFNDKTADLYIPGAKFEDILRASFARGQIKDFAGREAEWLAERMDLHRMATGSIEQEGHDGRRMLVTERRMGDGGIAALRTDITKLKMTEHALRESEARLRGFMENAPMAMMVKDRESRVIQANHLAAEYLNTTPDQLVGRRTVDILEPRHAALIMAHEQEVVSAGVPIAREIHFADRPRLEWSYEVKFPIHNVRGEGIGFGSIFMDITDRKKAERALRESEARLREAQNRAKLTYWYWFKATDDYEWSSETAALLGCTPDRLPMNQDDYLMIVDADDRNWLREFFDRRVDAYEVDYRIVRSDGSVRWIRELAETETNERGEVFREVGTLQDITEQKLVEEALRRNQRRLLRAQGQARISDWEWDIKTDICTWSDGAASVLQTTEDRLPRRLDEFFADLPTEERSGVLRDFRSSIERGVGYDIEYRALRDGDRTIWLREIAEVERDASGQPVKMAGTIQDITDRKRNEDALRESQARLKKAQRVARIGSWDWIPGTKNIHWSEEALEIFGYTGGALERPAQEWLERVHVDDLPAVNVKLAELNATGQSLSMIYRIVLPDQSIRVIREDIEESFDQAGVVIAESGTVQDVTEWDRTQRALRESEARLRGFMDNVPFAMYIKDTKSRYLMLNHEAERIEGMPAARICGRSPREVYVPALAERFEAEDREVVETGRPVTTEYNEPSLPFYRESLTVKFPIRDTEGDIIAIGGVTQDVSDRRRAERAVRESEARLREAQRRARLAYWSWDMATGDYQLSPEMAEIFGKESKGIPSDDREYLKLVDPADRSWFAMLSERMSKEPEDYTCEYRIRRPDGTIVWLREIAEAVRDEHGHVTGMVGTDQDITDLKRGEEALRQSESRMRAFMDHAPMMIYLKDAEGRYQIVNREFEQVEGVTEDRVRGKTVFDLLPRKDAELLDAADRDVMAHDRVIARELHDAGRTAYRDGFAVKFPVRDGDGHIVGVGGITQDITERKQVENALREGEGRLRRAQLQAKLASWSWDLDTKVWTWARGSGPALGMADAELPTQDAGQNDFVHPDDRAMLRRIDAGIEAGRDSYTAEFRCLRPDGTVFWAEEIGEVERDADGRRIAVSGTLQDISDRKRGEQALRESEARLRSFMDHAPFVAYLKDTEGRYALVNREFQRVENRSESDFIGKTAYDLVPREEADAWTESDQAVLDEGGIVTREFSQSRLGIYAHTLSVKFPVRDSDGRIIGIAGYAQDITERKRVELALRESESRLRRAQQQARLAYWSWQIETEEYQWAPGAGLILGMADRDLPYTEGGYLDLIHPDDRERMKRLYDEFEEVGTMFNHKFRILRPDGAVIWMREIGEIECDSSGRRVAVSGTIQDITEQHNLEEQLRQSQKMEAIGQLTGGIAHDFNNLLAVVLGNLELVTEQIGDNKKLAKGIDNATRASLRGADLTQRLLAFARRQVLAPVKTDVNALIAGMRDLLTRPLGPTVEFSSLFANEVWPIEIDQSQLESALLNMALNARDAMPEGGRLTITTSNAHIAAGESGRGGELQPGDYVLISVADTGGGMSEEIKSRAFDPFYTTKSLGKGTGLGLSMVYGFVKQSGGHIVIDSEVGVGTTMRIYLPRAGDGGSAVSAKAEVAVPRGHGETILVLEDEAEVATVAQRYLANLGYKVIVTADAESAMAKLASAPRVDLLLADVILGGKLDGRAVAKQAVARWPNLKVMFMSGYAPNGGLQDGDGEASAIHIAKPFQKADLARELRRVLDRHSRNQQGNNQ